MNLNVDQQKSLASGEPVRVQEAGIECVIVRADVYDQIKTVVYNASDWTEDEMRAIASRTFDDADAAGPIP